MKKRVNKKGNNRSPRKFCINNRNGSEILFSVGFGSLLAFYLIELCKPNLGLLSGKIESLIATGNNQDIYVGLWECLIFMVGFIAILIAPLLSQWNKNMSIKIFLLFVLVFANIGGFVSAVAQGRVFFLFIFVVWISSIYITWFCIGILRIIYYWLRLDKEEKEQFNVAKLTFLWAIIAFLLGRMMK